MSTEFDVVVLGGAAVDIMYKASDAGLTAERMHGQSSPCTLEKHCMGGVGRNIAEVLARLKLRVALLSMVGQDDDMGRFLLKGMQAVGIDTGCIQRSARGRATATYTALIGSDGELAAAAADMDIFLEMTGARLLGDAKVLRALKGTKCLVVDANIGEECCKAVIEHTKKVNPSCVVVFEAVSRAKCVRCASFLHLVDIVKPNLSEAMELAQVVAPNGRFSEKDPEAIVRAVVEIGGAKNALCTMGANGVLLGTRDASGPAALRRWNALPLAKGELKKVTGAGDSLLACTIYGVLKASTGRQAPETLTKAVELGLIGARMALVSAETINPNLPAAVEAFVAKRNVLRAKL